MGQASQAMAHFIACWIKTYGENEIAEGKTQEEAIRQGQGIFALTVFQVAMTSRNKASMAEYLEAIAADLRDEHAKENSGGNSGSDGGDVSPKE